MSLPANTDDKPRIFGYARVSKATGTGQLLKNIPDGYEPPEDPREPSIQRQFSALTDWAEKQGEPITLGFDEGISGAEVSYRDRPGFQKLVKQMKPGDKLAIWRLDRLERGMGRMIAAAKWLYDDCKVSVHALYENNGEGLNLDSVQGKALLYVFEMVAMFENESRKAATKAGLQYRRLVGQKYTQWAGYGRRFEKRKENGQTVTYVVWDETQCDIIREIKRRRDEGESWYRIGLDLHQRQGGKPSPNGGTWLTFSPSKMSKKEQGDPRKVVRVYKWYALLLHYGLDFGADGVPAGVDAMIREYGVDGDLVAKLLPNTSAETMRKNYKNPKKGMTGEAKGMPKRPKRRARVFEQPDLGEWTPTTEKKKEGKGE
jgi:DNA invertase Pin-like site-specific DNA recombinase